MMRRPIQFLLLVLVLVLLLGDSGSQATAVEATEGTTEAAPDTAPGVKDAKTDSPEHHQYLVIGAGPGGLQLTAHLIGAGRDVVLLEKSESLGAFYTRYPRQGRLESINKRFTGHSDPEFNLRFDWNSLLPGVPGDSESPVFTEWSQEFHPSRQEYLEYLRAYAEHHRLVIHFDREVVQVRKEPLHAGTGPNREPLFHVRDSRGKHWSCEILILATSRSRPYIPAEMEGIEHAIGYEDLEDPSLDPEGFRAKYQNKRILILGVGNAAFETAAALSPIAAAVHVVGRSKDGLRFAQETHYPGDVRALHSGVLDTFRLNALDAVDTGLDVREMQLVKEETDGLLYLRSAEDGQRHPQFRKGYDYVIRCLGWRFDDSMFDPETAVVEVSASGKFPVQTIDYESISTSNIFFAGDLMHFQDYRESEGGFVQGYRYLIRSLARRLGQRFHGDSLFRSPEPEVPGTPEGIAEALHARIQTSSGLYRMTGVLSDLVIWDTKYGEGKMADYVEEMILTGVTQQQSHPDALMWSLHFDYGPPEGEEEEATDGRTGASTAVLYPGQAHLSRLLHPIIRFYRPPSDKPGYFEQLAEFHLMEDFQMTWDDEELHFRPLVKFIERCIAGDYRTQGELLEERREMIFQSLTEQQRKSGITVLDSFYGEFNFRGEDEDLLQKLQDASPEILEAARAALKAEPIVHVHDEL